MPTLTGRSKTEIHPMCKLGFFDDLKGVPAVYMFVRIETDAETGEQETQVVYVGETEDVNDRLVESHHRMVDIRKRGATHIVIYRNEKDARLQSDDGRRRIEKALIKRHEPEIQRRKSADRLA